MVAPLWFLDVDGVINAIRPSVDLWDDWKHGGVTPSHSGFSYEIWCSTKVLNTITDLHTHGLVEVRWLTTWGSDANKSLRELTRLPVFDVVQEPPLFLQGDEKTWWKLEALQKDLGLTGRRFIWTDDDINRYPEAHKWARGLMADSLLISPDHRTGLTQQHLDQIALFAESQP